MKYVSPFLPPVSMNAAPVHQSALGPAPAGELTLSLPSASLVLTAQVIEAASVGLSAYHGYKRNDSVGWAVVWGVMGGLFPVIMPAIAFAQGFGQPAKK
jgi:hypothetical protein